MTYKVVRVRTEEDKRETALRVRDIVMVSSERDGSVVLHLRGGHHVTFSAAARQVEAREFYRDLLRAMEAE